MNTFEYAMQIEKDGEDYYRQLAQQTISKGMRTILAMLDDEIFPRDTKLSVHPKNSVPLRKTLS